MSRDTPDHYDVFGPAPPTDAFAEYLAPPGLAAAEAEAVEDDLATRQAITQRHEIEQEEYR